MAGTSRRPGRAAQRWAALLALAAGVAAVLALLVGVGVRSVTLLVVGVAGLAVVVAALWWAVTHRGVVRVLAVVLAVAAPVAVLLHYARLGVLWPIVLFLVLGAVAVIAGRWALSLDVEPAGSREYRTPPPERPFLIMNPRSGGGKVGRFGLVDKARGLGAEVVVLDPDRPQDVAGVAREAVAEGADLLGVAGGDGTQALVAGVAAEHGVPFMVIPAGTRNHFAMDLGLDRDDPAKSLEALSDGVELRVDLGLVGDRFFVNNASFGAYAAVVQSPAYRAEKVHTTLQMLPDLLTHQRGPRLTVRAANAAIDSPQAVLVSNNPYRTGDPAGLGRRERLDAGVLGVLGVTVDSAAQAAGLLRGGHAPGLTVLTAGEVVVDADASEVPVGVDGEALVLPVPVYCRVRPGALRVRVPRRRPARPRAGPPLDWRQLVRLAFAPPHGPPPAVPERS
ncbi:diacylglycerol/lipid kinase family protein [Thermomonospora amylolytica]|uniref:diacylglycerol/lipid kinase family protein n=1 Tax=Thermomonospora amylolytica TaxID=1411117 RepID=UPI0018EF3F58|nr:diacylglycerol kinase family protein [Thermomonospora amylolytica]